jgi:hypothetical protein
MVQSTVINIQITRRCTICYIKHFAKLFTANTVYEQKKGIDYNKNVFINVPIIRNNSTILIRFKAEILAQLLSGK